MHNPFRRNPPQIPPTRLRHRMSWLDERARDDANSALEQALNVWPDVRATVADIRVLRERNHLAEKIHRALGGADA